MSVDQRQQRAAENEHAFREVNVELDQLTDDGVATLVCECANTACTELIEVAHRDYVRVRDNDRWFLTAPSPQHVREDIEEVVERHPGFWVVAKTGFAGAVAEALAS